MHIPRDPGRILLPHAPAFTESIARADGVHPIVDGVDDELIIAIERRRPPTGHVEQHRLTYSLVPLLIIVESADARNFREQILNSSCTLDQTHEY
jgi:hypothetical protein